LNITERNGHEVRKEDPSFSEEKEAKRLYFWRLRLKNKSLLLLFFRKEGLAFTTPVDRSVRSSGCTFRPCQVKHPPPHRIIALP
jgi:hypothetical protein